MSQSIVYNASPGCGLFVTDTSKKKTGEGIGKAMKIPFRPDRSVQEKALSEELEIHKKLITVLEGKLGVAQTNFEREKERSEEQDLDLERLHDELDRMRNQTVVSYTTVKRRRMMDQNQM